MALSLETQAIVDRLKAEGDLIRNTGTNSIKSVNITLQKFEGVFNSISNNIAEQTKILQMQAGIATEALEATRTKEQLDEIESKQKEKDSDSNIDKVGDKIGESIDSSLKKAFSLSGLGSALKTIAGVGAAGFLGYNLGKGFINTAFAGDGESGLEKLEAKKIEVEEKAREAFAEMKQYGAELKKSVDGFKKSVDDLNKNMKDMIDEIAKLRDQLNLAKLAVGLISGFTALRWASKAMYKWGEIVERNMKNSKPKPPPDPNKPPKNVDPEGRKGRGDTYEKPGERAKYNKSNPTGAEPEGRKGRGDTYEKPGERAKYNKSVKNAAPKSNSTYSGRTSTGMNTPEARAQLRADIAAKTGSGYRLTKSGKLQGPDGKFASDEDALKYMEKTLDPKYSKVFKNLVKVLKVAGVAALLLTAYQIYDVLTNDSMSPKNKQIELGGLMGEVIGGAGGATIGAIAGAMGGPWGALIGGLTGGLVGLFAGGYLGEWIVRWAFDENPTAKDDADAKQIERDYVKRFVDEDAAMSQPVVSHDASGRVKPLHYGDLQQGMGIQGYNAAAQSRAAIAAENAARQSQEVLPPLRDAGASLQYGGRGNGYLEMGYRNGRSAARSSSLEMMDSYIMGRTGGNVYIDASTNAPVTYSNMDAGDNISMVQLSSGGGGSSSVNPFGLAGLTNAYNV